MESIEMPLPLMDKEAVEEKVVIPLDLGEWVPREQLRDLVIEIVDGLNWENPELIDAMDRNPEFEPKALLCTVSYAYATGVFSAEDIMRACSHDPAYKPFRPKLPPRHDELTTFRKMNRGILNFVVVQIITNALKAQFLDGDQFTALPPGLRRLVVENALERLNISRHMDRTGEH